MRVEKCLDNNKNAIIILHEIYGMNDFIKSQCLNYYEEGLDVSDSNSESYNKEEALKAMEAISAFLK